MRRWVTIAAATALVTGCIGVNPEPERDVFGVSAAPVAPAVPTAPAAPAAPAATDNAAAQTDAVLAWKVSQLCTNGAELMKRETVAAEEGQQIVDQQLRCKHYAFSLPLIGAIPAGPSLPAVFQAIPSP